MPRRRRRARRRRCSAAAQLPKSRSLVISCRTTAHTAVVWETANPGTADWRCGRLECDCRGRRRLAGGRLSAPRACDGSTSPRWNIRILYLYCTPGRRSRATSSVRRRIICGMHIPSISHAGPLCVRLAGLVGRGRGVCKTYDSAKDRRVWSAIFYWRHPCVCGWAISRLAMHFVSIPRITVYVRRIRKSRCSQVYHPVTNLTSRSI